MKLSIKKIFIASVLFAASLFPLAAVDTKAISFTASDGSKLTFDVPADLYEIVMQNYVRIQTALQAHNVTQAQLNAAQKVVNEQYDKLVTDKGVVNPYKTAVNGLNSFCEDLSDTIPNTQTLQNVWADSWVGYLVPGFNMGFGINAGLATLNVSSLKNAAESLAIDTKNIRDTLAFPTATADIRIGGLILPFDVGLTFMKFDTSKIGALDRKIDPVKVDYSSIGGDIRYKLMNFDLVLFNLRWSVSGGGYYTKGSVYCEDEKKGTNEPTSAKLEFNAKTLYAGTQVSAKVLCFTPFVGGRAVFTKTNVNWNVHADWTDIFSTSNSGLSDAIMWGILPTDFDGGAESKWEFRPQIYGGLGINLFKVGITASASYDMKTKVAGAAASVRIVL